MTDSELEDAILDCLLESEHLPLFNMKGYDRVLKQVELYCDYTLSQESISEIERSLREEVWGKLTVSIFRVQIPDSIV